MPTDLAIPATATSAATSGADSSADRDRWLDAVRAAALLVVVLGHWLLPVAVRTADGLAVDTLLVTTPAVHPVTLVLQVMGAFFLVGGVVSVRSWRRAQAVAAAPVGSPATRPALQALPARSEPSAPGSSPVGMSRRVVYSRWLGRRAAGLALPALPLLTLWAVVTPLLPAAGLAPDLAATAGTSALAPLWFLAVYLLVQAAVPAIDAVVARWGWIRPVAGLLAASALVDLAARGHVHQAAGGHVHQAAGGHGVTAAGLGGFLAVWLVPVVLGVALADGRLTPRHGWLLAAAGAAGVAVLVGVGGYPMLMVGTLPDGGSNQNPPSLALAALLLCHSGILVATRRRVTALLAGPRAGRWVRLAAAWSMPAFLWHMSAAVLAIGASLLHPAATLWLLELAPLDTAWWLARPLWCLVLAGWLVVLLLVAGRVTPPVVAALRRGRPVTAPTVILLAVGGAAVAIGAGAEQVDRPLAGLGAVALLALAGRLLGADGSGRDQPPAGGPADRRRARWVRRGATTG